MFDYSYYIAIAQTFSISLIICSILVITKAWHFKSSSRRNDGKAVQASHIHPTPRIGGIGIITAVILSLIFFMENNTNGIVPLFTLSIMPVFVAGLMEDFGFPVSPRERLLAAAASSAVAVAVLQMWVPRAHVPYIDYLFMFAPFAIIFTVFATAGICNAFNLIDGLNGLSSATAVITAAGLAAIAFNAGDNHIAANALMLIFAFLGFIVLNYPFGKIFLGDAGAYSIGHILAWVSVIIMVRSPDVTPWAVVLVFFWPLADTCYAVYRRRKSGKPFGEPDRLHHHQLFMRGLEITILGRGRRPLANPLTTLLMLPMIVAPVISGSLLWNQPVAAFFTVISFSVLFVSTYMAVIKFVVKKRRRRLRYLLRFRSGGQNQTLRRT